MEKTLDALTWKVSHSDTYVLAHFEISDSGGLLRESQLPDIVLPDQTKGCETRGLIFSGKGPVWLYAYLTHLAHAFVWLGVYDPRLAGAVVISRHRTDAPAIGEVVPCALPS